MWIALYQFQCLFADKPFESGDARLVFLQEIGSVDMLLKGAFLIIPDQMGMR